MRYWMMTTLFALTLTPAAQAAPVLFTVRDLGTLGGTSSMALGVSRTGRVYGTSNGQLFLWTGGTMQPMPPGGYGSAYGTAPSPAPDYKAVPTAANGFGQAAGYALKNGARTHAYRWTNDVPGDLNGQIPNAIESFGQAINESGDVAGYARLDRIQAAVWRADGTAAVLGGPGTGIESFGLGISEAGSVAGFFRKGGINTELPVVWDAAGVATELGRLSGFDGRAIVNDVNDFGRAVGLSGDPSNFTATRATMWQGTMPVDLNTVIAPGSGLTLLEAVGVNDVGQITGNAIDSAGNIRAFLLDPAVPEPGSAATMVAAAAGAAMTGRRRRSAR